MHHHRPNADNLHPHSKKQKTQSDSTTEVWNSGSLYQITNYFNTFKSGVNSVDGPNGTSVPNCHATSYGQTEKNHVDTSVTDDMDRRNSIANDGGKSLCTVAGIPFPSRLDALNKYRQKKKERCFRKKVSKKN